MCEHVLELAQHHLDAGEELLVLGTRGGVIDGPLQVVDDRQQLEHDTLPCPLDRVRLLARHALAVVVELSLSPLGRLEIAGGLGADLVDLLSQLIAAELELGTQILLELRIDGLRLVVLVGGPGGPPHVVEYTIRVSHDYSSPSTTS